MFEGRVIIQENEENEEYNQRRSYDCICNGVQCFVVFVLIFVLVYFIWFLFRMIDTMTFKMKYG